MPHYEIPRGRVLIDILTGVGIVVHGRGTPEHRLPVIAARFQLTAWRSKLDEYYTRDAGQGGS